MDKKIICKTNLELINSIDNKLSKRFIDLDPNGYFLIRVDSAAGELVVEHYSNDIDEIGRAIDPKTGKPLGCKASTKRTPLQIFRGRSAKEVGIQLTEGKDPLPISKLDHALYLGRELQRAEQCLLISKQYVQD